MRDRLKPASVWQQALLGAVSFFAVTVLWVVVVRDGSLAEAVVRGAVVAVAFGALLALVERRRRRRALEEFDWSPRAVAKRVRRAASHGPVPEDPDVREAAHELVLDHLRDLDRQRYWAPALFVGMAGLSVAVALTGVPWLWGTIPAWTAAAAAHPYLRGYLRRREELLRPGGPALAA